MRVHLAETRKHFELRIEELTQSYAESGDDGKRADIKTEIEELTLRLRRMMAH
jgi:hypothetical protein